MKNSIKKVEHHESAINDFINRFEFDFTTNPDAEVFEEGIASLRKKVSDHYEQTKSNLMELESDIQIASGWALSDVVSMADFQLAEQTLRALINRIESQIGDPARIPEEGNEEAAKDYQLWKSKAEYALALKKAALDYVLYNKEDDRASRIYALTVENHMALTVIKEFNLQLDKELFNSIVKTAMQKYDNLTTPTDKEDNHD